MSDELLLYRELQSIKHRLIRIERKVDALAQDALNEEVLATLAADIDQDTADLQAAVDAQQSPQTTHPTRRSSTVPNPVLQSTIDAATREHDVVQSAIVLINGISQRLTDGINAALANGATEAELAPLNDLVSAISTDTTALADAIAANTPAAPGSSPRAQQTKQAQQPTQAKKSP